MRPMNLLTSPRRASALVLLVLILNLTYRSSRRSHRTHGRYESFIARPSVAGNGCKESDCHADLHTTTWSSGRQDQAVLAESPNQAVWRTLKAILQDSRPPENAITLLGLPERPQDATGSVSVVMQDRIEISVASTIVMKRAHEEYVSRIKAGEVELHYEKGS